MRKFGLLGRSLSHSWSQDYWTKVFQRRQITDANYTHFELERIEEFPQLVKENPELEGLNVTVPYKELVLSYLNELDPDAEAIGAVNYIDLREGKRKGYNFDHVGFQKSVRPFLDHHHERCLILGTGGSAQAVAFAMRRIGLGILFVSRTPSAADQIGYEEVNDHVLNACKLIVNCTPVGMHPKTESHPEIPFEHLTNKHLVVDLIYNPTETVFLQKAREKNAITLNGESMLRFQADEAIGRFL